MLIIEIGKARYDGRVEKADNSDYFALDVGSGSVSRWNNPENAELFESVCAYINTGFWILGESDSACEELYIDYLVSTAHDSARAEASADFSAGLARFNSAVKLLMTAVDIECERDSEFVDAAMLLRQTKRCRRNCIRDPQRFVSRMLLNAQGITFVRQFLGNSSMHENLYSLARRLYAHSEQSGCAFSDQSVCENKVVWCSMPDDEVQDFSV